MSQLNSESKIKLNDYPQCEEKISNIKGIKKYTLNKNSLLDSCIKSEHEKIKITNRNIARENGLKKFPHCKGSFFGAGGNHKYGMECINRWQKMADDKAQKKEARKKYLSTPEGKEELRKEKDQKQNVFEVCEQVAKDVERKFNPGSYIGIFTSKKIGTTLYFCVANYKQQTVTGMQVQQHLQIIHNAESGKYQLKYL